MASWIRRPDPSSNVGEVDIANAVAERTSGVDALDCEAGVAMGFAVEFESCVELVETPAFRNAGTSPGFVNGDVEFAGAVVAVASAWDAGISGNMAWDAAASRAAVVGAAPSDAGSNPPKIIMVSFKPIRGVFMSRFLLADFSITVSGQP